MLGLGDIGPLAAKPVMEGKAVLFKKFAGIDVFDIEIAANDVDKLVDTIAAMEPTFGGINLEDIKAPECFEVERRLRERMSIPVFHDDQHGTAIIVAAAVRNGLGLAGKKMSEAKIVASGAGAAALACLELLVALGARRENIFVSDIEGVVLKGRNKLMDHDKETFAQETAARTLADIIPDADVFLGLFAGGVLKPGNGRGDGRRRSSWRSPTRSGDHARGRAGRAPRRHAVHRPLRLSQPGQQRPLLPLYFRGALDFTQPRSTKPSRLHC